MELDKDTCAACLIAAGVLAGMIGKATALPIILTVMDFIKTRRKQTARKRRSQKRKPAITKKGRVR